MLSLDSMERSECVRECFWILCKPADDPVVKADCDKLDRGDWLGGVNNCGVGFPKIDALRQVRFFSAHLTAINDSHSGQPESTFRSKRQPLMVPCNDHWLT